MLLTVVLLVGMVYFVVTAGVALTLQLAAWRRRDRAVALRERAIARERLVRYSTAETIRIPIEEPVRDELGVIDLDQARRARSAAPRDEWDEQHSYASGA